MYRHLSAILTLALLSANPAAAQSVKTASGSVRGSTAGDVTSFKGIPFAAPPVGANRWRAPIAVKPWRGERDATKFGAECAQVVPPFLPPRAADAPPLSEDCLFVNVWRPANTKPNAKLPVMVWIHGGAFVFGSGSQSTYSGEQFARQGVVLVTLNYRLGRFGFFAHPSLAQERPTEAKGNYAYMDQVAALKWVKRNIGAFGGNPGNVTIFGESAGGVSVHSLLSAPPAYGLFHKAIIESGGGRDGTLTGRPLRADNSDPLYPVSAETIGLNFARRHGIEGSDSAALAKLRALTADQIVDGGQETAGPGGPRTYSGPIIDGKLITETAQSAYAAGRQARVPLIIGSNSAEVPAGFLDADTKEKLFAGFGKGKDAAMAAYDPTRTADFATLMMQATTDRVWGEPARLTATAFAAKGAPAYIYRFSYVADSMKGQWKSGAPHASELEYVFDTVKQRYGDKLTATDQGVARMMNTYWANFARTGNPSGSALVAWPKFDPTSNQILDFRPDGTALGGPDPWKARLDATELSGGTVIAR